MVLLFPNFASTFRYYVRRAVGAFVQIEVTANFEDPTIPYAANFENPKLASYIEFENPTIPLELEFDQEANTIP